VSDIKEFRLPDVGEGLTEADIVAWHVKPGDAVRVNQVIVEIETAKAVVELPCPFDGVVTGLLAEEGQSVDVGTPIIAVDTAAGAGGTTAAVATPAAKPAGTGDAAPPVQRTRRHAPEDLVPPPPPDTAVEPGVEGSPAPKAERQAVLVGYGVKLGATTRRPRKRPAERHPVPPPPAHPAPPPHAAPPPPAHPAPGNGAGRVLAKPPVRKMAKDLGVDLAALSGSGPGGVITRDDVEAAARGVSAPPASAPVAATAPASAAVREERIAVRGVRKHTAAAVTESAFTAPHVTEFLQVDVTATMDAVRRLAELPEFAGVRVSPLLLVARALLLAVARHPMINSSWAEESQEIVVRHYVNLGIAAATSRGLLVPNIKDAQALSLPGLARALASLTATAREGKTQPADLAGGTISITNVGVFGVDAGTPILSPGEAAILAFGQVKDAPWVADGQLVVRKVTTLSLSFDHRIVDGDLGSAVLRDVGAMLTDPVRMLAWS
jgi:2-oxoisovalerate dehydrogenase E2 component (dihydrolipoyl transacylase)